MNKNILQFSCFAVLVLFAGLLLNSCGQRLSETTTTSTTSTSTTSTSTTTSTTSTTSPTIGSTSISGIILVPASSLTAGEIISSSMKILAADDGHSDTPLAATVQGYDPVTNAAITPATSCASDGTYTLTGVASEGSILLKATYSNAGKTTLVTTVATKGSIAAINAGTTTAWNKIKAKLSEKYGDLPEKASTLTSSDKNALLSDIASLFPINRQIVGTFESSSNLPTITFNYSNLASIETAMFENIPAKFDSEYASYSDATIKNSFTSYYSDIAAKAATLCVTAVYPANLEMPANISGFTIPSGFPFPSGVTFPPYRDSGYFDNVVNAISGVSGAKFNCRLPSGLAGKLPPAASILPSVSFEGSAWAASGKLPSGAIFSGVAPADVLSSGMYLPAGASFEAVSSITLPTNIYIDQGFVIPSSMAIQSGYTLPSYASFAPGAIIPSGVTITSGMRIPSGVITSGFIPPSGVIIESGVQLYGVTVNAGDRVPSGMFVGSGCTIQSGALMDSGVQFQSGLAFGAGYVIPSGIIAGSGVVVPSGVTLAPGAVMSGAIIGSGVTIPSGVALGSGTILSGAIVGSGATVPSGVNMSGVILASGANLGSGVVIPSGTSFGSGYVPPSGVSYGSGFQQPAGWVMPSGYITPEGWVRPPH